MIVLIEGFGPDAIALARLLVAEGDAVRLAASAPEPPEADDLRRSASPSSRAPTSMPIRAPAEVAFLDPWTPETADRVANAVRAGHSGVVSR